VLEGLVIAGMLAGGLGLFLLAVSMITDGLKAAAGNALRNLLSNWTRSALHGIFTGLAITAVVQSSSAVTVATIGFVNAGLLTMRRALGIVYGSNIGTTMTGWLVVIVGLKINIDLFALPIIGLGMILRLTGGDSRRASVGTALVGFGLFFIGIDVLKEAFDSLVVTIDLARFTLEGVWGVLMYLGIGFLMTVLTQSSSAAIAITLTATTGGVIGLYAAAAMVIGSNVGTTSTAAIAVIGATSNAKRVASAHIIFNLATGLVALMILPVLFWVVTATESLLGLEAIPVVTLALFHTLFNILGVLLMFPVNNHLASFLEKRFVTQEEIEGRPRYLDKTVAVSPALAINALALELARVTSVVSRMGLAVLSSERINIGQVASDNEVVKKLSTAISFFISQLERGSISQEISDQLAKVLRAEQHLLASTDQAMLIAHTRVQLEALNDKLLENGLAAFQASVANLMTMANSKETGFLSNDFDSQLEQIQLGYDELKADLLKAGADLQITIPLMMDVVDQNSRIRRMARQLVKAMYFIIEISKLVKMTKPSTESEPVLIEDTQDDFNENGRSLVPDVSTQDKARLAR